MAPPGVGVLPESLGDLPEGALRVYPRKPWGEADEEPIAKDVTRRARCLSSTMSCRPDAWPPDSLIGGAGRGQGPRPQTRLTRQGHSRGRVGRCGRAPRGTTRRSPLPERSALDPGKERDEVGPANACPPPTTCMGVIKAREWMSMSTSMKAIQPASERHDYHYEATSGEACQALQGDERGRASSAQAPVGPSANLRWHCRQD
jgi:hypothetical protein